MTSLMDSISHGNHFILDDLGTWPLDILDWLAENQASVQGYLDEEQRIDSLAEADIMLRVVRPGNEYYPVWTTLKEKIDARTRELSIVGFHCTRLIDEEIADIIANGLVPLAEKTTRQRIERVRSNCLISKETYQALLTNNQADAPGRTGRIWMFHCLSTLRNDEVGLIRLFCNWGGEAVYNNHETNPQVIGELQQIGTPSIVVCSIPCRSLDMFPQSLPEKMMRYWYNLKCERFFKLDLDTCMRSPVKALRIISELEPEFEVMTKFSEWNFLGNEACYNRCLP